LRARGAHRLPGEGANGPQDHDLESLKSLEDAGCEVRYSTRLHEKVLIADAASAIVSSSNLTASAGYSARRGTAPDWRNEELGVLLED